MYKATARYGFGFTDWRSTFGSSASMLMTYKELEDVYPDHALWDVSVLELENLWLARFGEQGVATEPELTGVEWALITRRLENCKRVKMRAGGWTHDDGTPTLLKG